MNGSSPKAPTSPDSNSDQLRAAHELYLSRMRGAQGHPLKQVGAILDRLDAQRLHGTDDGQAAGELAAAAVERARRG